MTVAFGRPEVTRMAETGSQGSGSAGAAGAGDEKGDWRVVLQFFVVPLALVAVLVTVFFGILGPAAFAYMVRETARMRSTQSATGILYMAMIFVVYGEFLARYLTVAGAGPM